MQNYNTKKYYCNSYRNHLSLFPNTKKKMKNTVKELNAKYEAMLGAMNK